MSADWLALGAYALLIGAYLDKFSTRRGAAAIVGLSLLAASKQLDIMDREPTLQKVLERLGFCTLILSIAFTHWYDVIGILGYGAAMTGNVEAAAPIIALYNVMGLQGADGLYFVAKGVFALALVLGYNVRDILVFVNDEKSIVEQ